MATALADNYTHLLVIRFFLGVTESPYFPGALFLLSSWYPKKVCRRCVFERLDCCAKLILD
jgi:MFS family permease